MTRNTILGIIAALLLQSVQGNACTLWGAAGSAAACGGTIINKNRDERDNHTQIIKLYRPRRGYAYLGLFVTQKDSNLLDFRNAINEKGLSAISATAGSIPREQRVARGKYDVMPRLITQCASCDEVLERQKEFFPHCSARFIMLSDGHKIIVAQIATNGIYKLKVVENGSVAQTNHFIDKEFEVFNSVIKESTRERFKRISYLLEHTPAPYTIAHFRDFCHDNHAGTNNSIFRTAAPVRTLATWIVETPRQGPPRLEIEITSPRQLQRTLSLVLDERFWRETEGEL